MKEEGGIAYIPRGHGNLFVSHEMKHFVQVLYRSACIELYVLLVALASFCMCEECAIITGGEKAYTKNYHLQLLVCVTKQHKGNCWDSTSTRTGLKISSCKHGGRRSWVVEDTLNKQRVTD